MKKAYSDYINEFKKLRGRIKIRLSSSTLILLNHPYNDSFIVPVCGREICISGNFKEFNINAEEYKFITLSVNSEGVEMFDVEVIKPFI